MLGAMVATREGRHIAIDLLSRYLPATWLVWLTLINGLIASTICALVAWFTLDLVIIEYEDQTTAFGDIPTWLCQSIMPFGFAIMAFRFLLMALRGPWDLLRGAGPDEVTGS